VNVVHLDAELSERIEALKNSSEDFEAKIHSAVNKAVNDVLDEWVDQKLDQERFAFETQHAQLVETYLGKYVAFHEGKLIDADESERQLYIRVRHRFPQTVVAIFPVDETSEMRTHHSTRTQLSSRMKGN
jgi:hypothetical protein